MIYCEKIQTFLFYCCNLVSPQMEKVEEDLIRSKTLREKQAKEFSQQLDALRQKYEQQVCIKLGLSVPVAFIPHRNILYVMSESLACLS